MLFNSKKPHYEYLRKKWTAKHRQLQDNIWSKHSQALNWLGKKIPQPNLGVQGRQLALGGLGGLMMLATPAGMLLPSSHLLAAGGEQISKDTDRNMLVASKLKGVVPEDMRPLTIKEEDEVSQVLSDSYGMKVSAALDNKKLNRSYGLIGGEQHLYRFPGDTLQAHADTTADWAMFGSAGIAPGLGAWGYFASSQPQFSEKDKMREKYYLAVQTFLAPGFAERVGEYRDFFKFRKMLVVNPKTGQAVVAVIGDAGPAEWTGKHLGGSPEVMHYLGLATGPRKGAVLYFFIDDPTDKIPLGPIKVVTGES